MDSRWKQPVVFMIIGFVLVGNLGLNRSVSIQTDEQQAVIPLENATLSNKEVSSFNKNLIQITIKIFTGMSKRTRIIKHIFTINL